MNTRISGIGMTSQRTRMRMVERLRDQGVRDEQVLAAMLDIPRHIFVDEALSSRAYDDVSLPIGFGQTISNPFTVARMVELARGGRALEKVLEIGTGCGYQAAVLSRVAKGVYSVERLAGLLSKARIRLRELGIRNVKVKHGDGHAGLKEVGPFDAIVIAAAATHLPELLAEQLAQGGRLVLPLGTREQRLVLVERTADGFTQSVLDEVKFVPMIAGTSA
ncbi:MAG TPA: protein-L-isoaspartate(D-aspartate) O-methyltransferase [Burkholderiales bacterium]|nr:protein-L-isoaspartate(D-aspartate) O-methyltransferase [Burkholderiales bacterium]